MISATDWCLFPPQALSFQQEPRDGISEFFESIPSANRHYVGNSESIEHWQVERKQLPQPNVGKYRRFGTNFGKHLLPAKHLLKYGLGCVHWQIQVKGLAPVAANLICCEAPADAFLHIVDTVKGS